MDLAINVFIILLATLGTAFLSSIFGMLGGLLLIGVLISILPINQAMIFHGIIQLTSNSYRAWLNKKDINWKIISTLIIGSLTSLIVLILIGFMPDKITVLLILGLMPYVAWALPKKNSLDINKKLTSFFAGIVVVASNLFSGTGGPLLDIFFQRTNMTRHQVVATKAVAQSLGHISKVVFFGYIATSNLNTWSSSWVILAMICSVIGTTLGKRVLDRINDQKFFLWTQNFLLAIGATYIVYAFYLMY